MKVIVAIILIFSLGTYAEKKKRNSGHLLGAAGSAAGATSGMGVIGNGTYAKKLSRTCGMNAGCWILVGMATYQSIEYFKSNEQHDEVCKTVNCDTGGVVGGTTGGGDGMTTGGAGRTTGLTGPNYRVGNFKNAFDLYKKANPDMADLINQMNDRGVSIDANGNLRTPNGTFTPAQLSTANGLTDAGVTSKDLALAEKVGKEIENELKAKLSAGGQEDGGSFGGGGSRDSGIDSSDRELKDYLKRMMRKPASKESLAGLSVMHNGEPVGIAQGNIFETITRRYDKLQESGAIGLQAK